MVKAIIAKANSLITEKESISPALNILLVNEGPRSRPATKYPETLEV